MTEKDLNEKYTFEEKNTDSEFFRMHTLQTYTSPVLLHDKKRIYRSVFEKKEITFLYVEFSFYNKKFDEENWDADIELVLYKLSEDIPDIIDVTDKHQIIDASENIVTITDHYGSDIAGEKWEKGVYRYEARINGKLADTHIFFVQDYGLVSPTHNPYFNVYGLKLFESGAQPREYGDRHYLSGFRFDATRYVWAEFEFENLLQGKDWMGEFVFRYFNDARLPVGEKCVMMPVSTLGQNRTFRVEAGLGHETQVSWYKDYYTLEIWFMGIKVAATAFESGDKEKYGTSRIEIPETDKKPDPAKTREKEKKEGTSPEDSFSVDGKVPDEEKLLANLNAMVGLDSITQKIREYIAFVKFKQLMDSKGLESADPVNIHAAFLGNPGTGKTTVARELGKVYHELGLLSTPRVFEADRSHLVGRFIGDTAPMTKDVIEKARGGILFIDEAYALSRKSDEKDFGKEVLEILLKEMSDGPGDIAIIVAGYPVQMKQFLEFNPGLRSRFQNIYDFPDYLPDELLQIAHIKAERKKLKINKEAEYIIHQLLNEEYRNRDKTFGNARLVGSLIESAQLNLGVRIMKTPNPEKLPVEKICTITKEDVHCISFKPGRKKTELPVNEELLHLGLSGINDMTGLEKVKQEVHDLVSLVRYQKEINKKILNSLSLHNVFLGNPGTGKTTVARLMAQIFKALGLLERGHLVECNRENLVAGHVGQTAIKTNNIIDHALGGVLFIDEAYALASAGQNDFGSEAIEVLLKRMEDDRGQFAVILAGYTKEMQVFLDSNPGLRSRIDNLILFEDFSIPELEDIAQNMFREKGLTPEKEAMKVISDYFALHVENRDRFFGNARFVRKVTEKALRNQLLRMGSQRPEERTLQMMQTLTLEDVKEFRESEDTLQGGNTIGFSVRKR